MQALNRNLKTFFHIYTFFYSIRSRKNSWNLKPFFHIYTFFYSIRSRKNSWNFKANSKLSVWQQPPDNLRNEVKWSEVTQLCPTLCDPVDCSPPGSSVHGILQARVLEWVTISFSRGSSWPRYRTQVSHIGGRCFNLWATREAQYIRTSAEQNAGKMGLRLVVRDSK